MTRVGVAEAMVRGADDYLPYELAEELHRSLQALQVPLPQTLALLLRYACGQLGSAEGEPFLAQVCQVGHTPARFLLWNMC